jgi:hypothetical protein
MDLATTEGYEKDAWNVLERDDDRVGGGVDRSVDAGDVFFVVAPAVCIRFFPSGGFAVAIRKIRSICHRNEQMAEGTKPRVIIRESIHQSSRNICATAPQSWPHQPQMGSAPCSLMMDVNHHHQHKQEGRAAAAPQEEEKHQQETRGRNYSSPEHHDDERKRCAQRRRLERRQ